MCLAEINEQGLLVFNAIGYWLCHYHFFPGCQIFRGDITCAWTKRDLVNIVPGSETAAMITRHGGDKHCSGLTNICHANKT